MNVYVASALGNRELAHYVAELLSIHGYHVVSTWHSDHGLPEVDPSEEDARKRIALVCLEEVRKAKILIALFTDKVCRGTYVELGVALERGARVFILNRANRSGARHSIFDSAPGVTVAEDTRELLSLLPGPEFPEPDAPTLEWPLGRAMAEAAHGDNVAGEEYEAGDRGVPGGDSGGAEG